MSDATYEAALRLLPPLRRARLWRLYAEDGRRFLDLWQDGGRGLLGARGKGLGSSTKAALDKGLDRPLPSRLEARLEKTALGLWAPAKACRIYLSEDRALAALAGLLGLAPPLLGRGGLLGASLVQDPARRPGGRGVVLPPALLLRPFARFLGGSPGASAPDAPPSSGSGSGSGSGPDFAFALPLLPLAQGLGPAILLFADAEAARRAGPGDLVPPLLLASALGALAAQAAYEAACGEEVWKRVDRRTDRHFARSGPWLFPRLQGEDYARLFEAALGCGLLISPDPGLPSLVPGDFDDGELAPLASLAPANDTP